VFPTSQSYGVFRLPVRSLSLSLRVRQRSRIFKVEHVPLNILWKSAPARFRFRRDKSRRTRLQEVYLSPCTPYVDGYLASRALASSAFSMDAMFNALFRGFQANMHA